jgi:hypothetical protein
MTMTIRTPGCIVMYRDGDGSVHPAIVIAVDAEGAPRLRVLRPSPQGDAPFVIGGRDLELSPPFSPTPKPNCWSPS